MRSLLIICGLIGLISPDAAAQRMYRCNGMVQFYPCDQELFKKRPSSPSARAMGSTSSSTRSNGAVRPELAPPGTYAQVLKKSYQRAGNQGWWRGTVKGNGHVHLHLQIVRNGVIESTRYMGSVLLKERSTWFSFKSPLPGGHGWSWNITAIAS